MKHRTETPGDTTPPTRVAPRRPIRALIAAGLVASTLPLLTAAPAQALSSSGCTVTPITPYVVGSNLSGQKIIRHELRVTCDANRKITLQQESREQDLVIDNTTGTRFYELTFTGAGTRTLIFDAPLPDTEPGDEEVYQRVRFVVASNGVIGRWTGWENSGVRQIPN